MKYLSVCSGIESATVAWHPLGWEPVAFSEIEPFPCRLLAERYPSIPNLGDMTQFQTWNDYAIDLLVGGTPCQAFSVAGLRKGLDDPRGNLTLTYLAVAARHRPRWVVWENVPGVLSIDQGRTFGAFLGGLGKLGYGWAYRVLDAQYFGVPQRRRRVFVVGHLGSWQRAAAVLFERACLSGNPAPRRESGKGVAPTLVARTRGGGGLGSDFDLGGGLVTHALTGEGFDASEDGTGRGTPLVPVAFGQCHGGSVGEPGTLKGKNATSGIPFIAFSCKDHGADAGETAPTLRAMGHGESHANAGGQIAVAIPIQEIGKRTGKSTTDRQNGIGIGEDGSPMFTLQASAQHGVAMSVSLRGREGGGTAELGDDKAMALRASQGGGDKPHVLHDMAVRRLTPRECERLQGFPDDYTLIDYGGRASKSKIEADVLKYFLRAGYSEEAAEMAAKHPDGPRYKALGNSKATPVVNWLGRRIDAVDSLFSA